jgi:hypothetical protein
LASDRYYCPEEYSVTFILVPAPAWSTRGLTDEGQATSAPAQAESVDAAIRFCDESMKQAAMKLFAPAVMVISLLAARVAFGQAGDPTASDALPQAYQGSQTITVTRSAEHIPAKASAEHCLLRSPAIMLSRLVANRMLQRFLSSTFFDSTCTRNANQPVGSAVCSRLLSERSYIGDSISTRFLAFLVTT